MSLSFGQIPQTYNREELIKPFIQIFDQSADKFKEQFTLSQTLDIIFPEQKKQEKNIKEARQILGELANNLTDFEIKEVLTDIDFLITNWMDEFEKQLFKGKTLKELLNE